VTRVNDCTGTGDISLLPAHRLLKSRRKIIGAIVTNNDDFVVLPATGKSVHADNNISIFGKCKIQYRSRTSAPTIHTYIYEAKN